MRREPGNQGSTLQRPSPSPRGLLGGDACRDPPSFSLQWRRVPTLWPPVISPPGWSLADIFPLLRNTPRPRLPKPLPLQCRKPGGLSCPEGTWLPYSVLALLFLMSVRSSSPSSMAASAPDDCFPAFSWRPHAPAQWAQTWCLLGAGTLTSGFSLWFPNHKPSCTGCNCP